MAERNKESRPGITHDPHPVLNRRYDLLADADAYEAVGVDPSDAKDWAAYDKLVLATMERLGNRK